MAASDASAKEAAFLHAFQTTYFNETRTQGTPSQRADVVRSLISQIEAARVSGLISEDAALSLDKQYEADYAAIVDNFDSKSGTNNYAEGALALCSLNRNESQSWKSSLTLESAKKLPGVQRLLQAAKASSNRHHLAEKMNDVIPLKTPASKPANTSVTPSMVTSCATVTTTLPSQRQPTLLQNGQSSLFSNSGPLRPGVNDLNNPELNQNIGGFHPSAFPKHPSMVTSNGPIWPSTEHRPGTASGQSYNSAGHHQPAKACAPVQHRPLFATNNRAPFPVAAVGHAEAMDTFQRKTQGMKRMPPGDEDQGDNIATGMFKTAREQLVLDSQRRHGGQTREQQSVTSSSYGSAKRSLGTRRGPANRFIPPVMNEDGGSNLLLQKAGPHSNARGPIGQGTGTSSGDDVTDERLKGLEPKMIELIMNEIMDHGAPVSWDDVAGLEFAKKTIKEIVVWPMLRPDIFTGLRGPPKGMLLFGPPGTGKTLIGKCIASQSKSTFFSISASSLTSKWVGEGEKMVRALFGVSRCHQPAVIFIDEIDSLLTQRSDGEHEASRRIKTEFLVQLDGATTESDERILVIGATNRPQEIDEAARRRFVKRLYIPLPEAAARKQIIINLLHQQTFQLTDENLTDISIKADGYSGADMANLCREAALGPIRSVNFADIETISADQVRPILYEDFEDAFNHVRASVSTKDLDVYIDWNNLYGSGSK